MPCDQLCICYMLRTLAVLMQSQVLDLHQISLSVQCDSSQAWLVVVVVVVVVMLVVVVVVVVDVFRDRRRHRRRRRCCRCCRHAQLCLI